MFDLLDLATPPHLRQLLWWLTLPLTHGLTFRRACSGTRPSAKGGDGWADFAGAPDGARCPRLRRLAVADGWDAFASAPGHRCCRRSRGSRVDR